MLLKFTGKIPASGLEKKHNGKHKKSFIKLSQESPNLPLPTREGLNVMSTIHMY